MAIDISMNIANVTFGVGIITGLLAVLFGLVSSPTYGWLFIAVEITGAIAIGCAIYLFRRSSKLFPAAVVPGLMAAYAISDVLLRQFGVGRFLDFLG